MTVDHSDTGPDRTTDSAGAAAEDLNRGPRRVLATLYGIFALAATARAGVQISTRFHEAPLAYSLSLFSGVVYIAATIGLTTQRRWSRTLAWVACGVELIGVLVIGTLSVVDAVAFPDDTVWSRYGSGYVYIPVILPLLGLSWLFATRHRGGTGTDTGTGSGTAASSG